MSKSIQGFIFDLDGTVYLSEKALPGAVETLALIRAHGLPYVFITNKPLQPGSTYAAKLTQLGIPATPDDVITSGRVMGSYLAQIAPGAHVFVIGEPPLLQEIRQAGMILSEEPEKIEFVVAAFDRTFDYRKWNIAFQAIKFHNAHFVATNGDKSCPIEGGEIPDCAGIIAALEATTGKKCEQIVGKPSPVIIQTSVARLGVPVDECLVVGDRLETDIVMGCSAGAQTALVLSGVTRRDQLKSSQVQADYVLESIAEIPSVVMKWKTTSL